MITIPPEIQSLIQTHRPFQTWWDLGGIHRAALFKIANLPMVPVVASQGMLRSITRDQEYDDRTKYLHLKRGKYDLIKMSVIGCMARGKLCSSGCAGETHVCEIGLGDGAGGSMASLRRCYECVDERLIDVNSLED